jgi:thiaminase (transcriptional activator TenA)
MNPTTSSMEAARQAIQNDEPFSQVLKKAAGDCWQETTRHRFVKQIADDTIDDAVYRNYLVQDHVFVDSLIRLVARGVAAAHDLEAQRRLTRFLGVLTSEENDYFQRSFDALEVSPEDRQAAIVRPVTYAFEDLFRAAVEEYQYLGVIGVLLPVEWTYYEWAKWAKEQGKSDRFWVQEWVDLHATKEFGAFIDWLKQEADEHAKRVDPKTRERVMARFVRAVDLEVAFFDDAYMATK